METLQEAGFADACFAADQHYVPFTGDRAFLPTHHQTQFIIAPDEWSQSMGSRRRFESASHSTGLNNSVKLKRPFDTLNDLRPLIFNYEQT